MNSSEHVSETLEFCTTPDKIHTMVDAKQESHADLTTTQTEHAHQDELQTTPGESPPNASSKQWNLIIITFSLALGTFLVALDTLIVGIAIPTITSQFHSLDDIAWYGSAYLITLTALQPSFGKIYKVYNAKWTYLTCVALFEVGSIICATAPKSAVFIVGRAIAGSGAAGLFQGAFNIITRTVALEKRPLYLGIVISVWGISVCIGPVLGGALTQDATWRWCFWINVPIGAVASLLILIFLKSETGRRIRAPVSWWEQLKQLDPIGAGTSIASVCCLLLALQWGGSTKPWNSATVIGLLTGFVLLLLVFCILQYKLGEDSTIPMRILKQRSILFGSLFLMSSAMSAYVWGYYLPIYFQSIKGSSPTRSGVEYMALALPQIVFIVIAGAIATQWGYYVPYLIGGTAIQAIGAGLLITLDVDSPKYKWATYMVITGIGTGISVNLPYTAVQVVLEEEDVPAGNAIAQFAYQLGAAIGLSVGQTIFLNKLGSEVRARIPSIRPQTVIAAGALDLSRLAPDPETLRLLRGAYAVAIRTSFIFALAVVCLAFVFSFGPENLNVKAIAQKRKDRKEQCTGTNVKENC
ncbi:efflux pump antibiotic resistance protein [Polyplosphaeria fusca]|uniref:Efflux pump antibiotic resistance protein n=1 Tax=Polyplosphaeria fusca TaxID=682080 RepID=A0A9P4QGB5_9PLEO|nr:efflux pump antibiotic resistance protein [Polyplosphaeria fusca]